MSRVRSASRRALAVAVVVALGGWQPFRSPDPDVTAGNQAYAEGRYSDAIAAYDRAALTAGVDPEGLAFDRGTAELAAAGKLADPAAKQAMTNEAFGHLKQATKSSDPQVRGAAHYNEGNSLLGAGKLDDAIESYKQALREDPAQEDARTNLEVALRRKQKSNGQGQGQGQGQGNGQGQNPGGQQGQGPQSPGQGQPGQGSGSGPGSQQPQQGSGQGSQQPQQGSGQGSQQPPQQGSGQGSQQQPQQGSGQGSQQQPQQGSGSGQGSQAQPQQGSGQGSQQPQGPQGQNPSPDGQPGQQTGQDPNHNGKPRHGAHASHGDSPRSPSDRKLDDLEDYSRRMQRDAARRHATGHPSDPDHDW